MRYIESDEGQSMRGAKLEEAIVADKEKGLVPFWVSLHLPQIITGKSFCPVQFQMQHG